MGTLLTLAMLLGGVAYLNVHFAPRFADRPVDVRFLMQLRAASKTREGWTTKPGEVALRLVAADLFPSDRPPQTNATVRLERSWSGRYVVSVTESFFEQGTVVMATYDRVTLQEEGSGWIPVGRKVSWQTINRPGWRTDLP